VNAPSTARTAAPTRVEGAAVELVSVSAGYSKAEVLHDVSLRVDPHEIVGLLGSNGAGKSTVLRAISGTLPHCRGDIVLAGRPLKRLAPWARVAAGVVHVPEGRHVFPTMTVRENLEVSGLVRRERVSVGEVMDLFPRLAQRDRHLAGSLSGGEQQMLAIGRALMTGPSVLIVDEMSAGLAPILVHQLMDGLVHLRTTGVAVLLVEQSPHFIAGAVDRVYLIEQGRIIDSGSLDELGGAERLARTYLGL
jgi:branched-chain amino acid transport system ATP-binding protein